MLEFHSKFNDLPSSDRRNNQQNQIVTLITSRKSSPKTAKNRVSGYHH